MLAHHLKIAARQLRRALAPALLNVVTLALGLACFVAASTIVGFWNRAEPRRESCGAGQTRHGPALRVDPC